MKLAIAFGAMTPTIADQLKSQGATAAGQLLNQWQRDAKAITRLAVRRASARRPHARGISSMSDVNSMKGRGVYFTTDVGGQPWFKFVAVQEAEHHLCERCIETVISASSTRGLGK